MPYVKPQRQQLRPAALHSARRLRHRRGPWQRQAVYLVYMSNRPEAGSGSTAVHPYVCPAENGI